MQSSSMPKQAIPSTAAIAADGSSVPAQKSLNGHQNPPCLSAATVDTSIPRSDTQIHPIPIGSRGVSASASSQKVEPDFLSVISQLKEDQDFLSQCLNIEPLTLPEKPESAEELSAYQTRVLMIAAGVNELTNNLKKELKECFPASALKSAKALEEYFPISALKSKEDCKQAFEQALRQTALRDQAYSELVEEFTHLGRSIRSTGKELTRKIMDDPTSLIPYIYKDEGFYITTGMPHSSFVVPTLIREQFISDDLKKHLSSIIRWKTASFTLYIPDANTKEVGHLMKTAAKNLLAISDEKIELVKDSPETKLLKKVGVAMDDSDPETLTTMLTVNKSLPGRDSTRLGMCLNLSTPDSEKQECRLAIYNPQSNKLLIMDNSGGKWSIPSLSGIILQPNETKNPGTLSWQKSLLYGFSTDEIETNPLICDKGPRIKDGKTDVQSYSKTGEYFLTQNMIEELSLCQSKSAYRTPVCKNSTDISKALESMLAPNSSANSATSLILYCDSTNHFVQVRILKRRDSFLVYINETLNVNCVAAKSLRDMMISALRIKSIKRQFFFLTPEQPSQTSFSDCGVFALKAVRSFEKHAELDKWLWETATDGAALNQEGKKITLENMHVLPQKSLIPLNMMHPRLLKLYQGLFSDLEKTLEGKMSEIVSGSLSKENALSLADYIKKYRFQNVVETEAQASKEPPIINLSAITKRYKYLLQWESMLLSRRPTPKSGVEEKLLSKFKEVVKANNKSETNQLMQRHGYGEYKIDNHDWDMSLVMEKFLLTEHPSISPNQASELKIWLTSVINPDSTVTPRDELRQAWCYHIRKSENSRLKMASLEDILSAVDEYIANNSRGKRTRKKPAHFQDQPVKRQKN